MMLWYKAWRESQARFTMIALTLTVFCLFTVAFRNQIQAHGSFVPPNLRSSIYSEHIYHLIYWGTAKGVFAFLVIFLGLGGLLRERARGTATFTLALPVRRWRIVVAQIVV